MTTNRIPPCMLCYPNDGFVRATEDMNGNTCGDIRFGEPPSCTFKERVVETLDKIAPVVTVLLEFIPTGVPVAQALRTISCSAIGYCAARKGMDIYDKATHGEEYVTDLVHFATTISVLAARRMIPRYLRSVALQKRSLTFWESTIISGVLRGLSVTAAVILAMLVHRISLKRLRESKPITAQDVMDLLVAAFDFHSCFMSPKTAEAMLKEALRDISVKEILNSVPGKTAIIEPYSDGRITDQVDLGKAETIEMTKDNQECEAMVETPKNEPGGQVLELQEKISPMEEEMRNLKSSHSVCETQFKKREQKMVVETSEGDIFNKSSQAYRSCKELEMEQVLGRIRDRLEMIKNHEETILNTKEKLKSAAVSDEAAGRRIMHTSAIDIDNLANEVLRMQHEYLEKIECDMEDEVAQKTYRDFVDKETNNCDRRRRIDQNNRIIETVTVMDAEKVFKLVSLTKSQICFANGESLDLLVNNQFEVSPRVMDQMDRSAVMVEKVENSAGPETEVFKNDLEEAMRLTQQFDANQLDRSTYLDRIHRVLQKYKMSIRGEDAAAASQQLQRAASSLPKESQKMFENMAPCLASSTKITLQGTPPGVLVDIS
ncbi:unnamed protein product [Heligmosomoides polygyrus]|uniref:DUF4781 domain-containing protein n=1 Tax=Heligmosomoides polygyrus TaxID=6339 RepID=A0A3P8FWB7_HELPZ|nr:unnamed protein product [Heligmosomoides polygyrus]